MIFNFDMKDIKLNLQHVFPRKTISVLMQIKERKRCEGFLAVICAGGKALKEFLLKYFEFMTYRLFKYRRSFSFGGKTLRYFYGLYNTAWKNERSIEIPIIRSFMKRYNGTDILEVGNVLQHYLPVRHAVLDKYEKFRDVINEDVVSFQPDRKYDLIVSISTIEHVGYDEDVKDDSKILQGIENMENLLSHKGKIVMTLPLGYNPSLDAFIKDGSIHFTKIYSFRRISADNLWTEVNFNDIRNAECDSPFPGVNILIVGVIEKGNV